MDSSRIVGCRGPGTFAIRVAWMIGLIMCAAFAPTAGAVPSFARQTHQPCTSCHIGGFGPQLTPFGRAFKRMGYTLSIGTDTEVPLSMMLIESFTHTAKAQTSPPADGFGAGRRASDNRTLYLFTWLSF